MYDDNVVRATSLKRYVLECDPTKFPVVYWQEELVMNEKMRAFGYIFLGEQQRDVADASKQRRLIDAYAVALGLAIDDIFIERQASLLQPFTEREEGSRILNRCGPGDMIILTRAEWILSSASEGGRLLQRLRNNDVSLHCIDLGGDISLDERRKLRVHEGHAKMVQKLLTALAVCENNRHGEAIKAVKQKRKKQGKYLGGPVPFGWNIDEDGFFVQNASQQAVIEAIIGMREDRWSYRDISTKLRKEFDIQLSHAGVRKVLVNDQKRKAAELDMKRSKESHLSR